MQEKFAIYA